MDARRGSVVSSVSSLRQVADVDLLNFIDASSCRVLRVLRALVRDKRLVHNKKCRFAFPLEMGLSR